MRKILILIGLIFLIFACHKNGPSKGSLSVTLENIPHGTVLNLVDIETGSVVQRITVNNDCFSIGINLPTPKLFGIWEDNPKYEKYRKFVWLENSNITIKGNYEYFVNAKVEGSSSNLINEKFEKIEREFFNQLSNLKRLGTMANNIQIKDSISKEIIVVMAKFKEQKKQLYVNNIVTEVAFYKLVQEITDENSLFHKKDIDSLYKLLPKKFQLSKNGDLLKEYIALPAKPKVGEKFVDCFLVTPDGKNQSISENLGKFTLIEFWSSSCGPCRIEHPGLRKIYNRYHDKGLNIISISGDYNLDDWKDAIKKDSLTWANLSDLKGFQNKAFLIYGIKYIPQTILLDKNGTILNCNLFF